MLASLNNKPKSPKIKSIRLAIKMYLVYSTNKYKNKPMIEVRIIIIKDMVKIVFLKFSKGV